MNIMLIAKKTISIYTVCILGSMAYGAQFNELTTAALNGEVAGALLSNSTTAHYLEPESSTDTSKQFIERVAYVLNNIKTTLPEYLSTQINDEATLSTVKNIIKSNVQTLACKIYIAKLFTNKEDITTLGNICKMNDQEAAKLAADIEEAQHEQSSVSNDQAKRAALAAIQKDLAQFTSQVQHVPQAILNGTDYAIVVLLTLLLSYGPRLYVDGVLDVNRWQALTLPCIYFILLQFATTANNFKKKN